MIEFCLLMIYVLGATQTKFLIDAKAEIRQEWWNCFTKIIICIFWPINAIMGPFINRKLICEVDEG